MQIELYIRAVYRAHLFMLPTVQEGIKKTSKVLEPIFVSSVSAIQSQYSRPVNREDRTGISEEIKYPGVFQTIVIIAYAINMQCT